ncbi:MAG: Hint domain-containing protein, partial [Fimbriiglobus sp.]
AGRVTSALASRVGSAVGKAASAGAKQVGRALEHQFGAAAIKNWVHGTMGKTVLHKPLTWAGRKAGLDVCFTGKMQLQLADGGWVRCDELRPGLMLASRDEHDVNGEIAGKVVEEVFERWGLVWVVNVDGKEIETTAEHPFWVDGREWTPANELQVGDGVRLRDGWGKVEGVRDTGRWETVYNCRVADFHTYFVGQAGWAWSVWAHNVYNIKSALRDVQILEKAGVQGAAELKKMLLTTKGAARKGYTFQTRRAMEYHNANLLDQIEFKLVPGDAKSKVLDLRLKDGSLVETKAFKWNTDAQLDAMRQKGGVYESIADRLEKQYDSQARHLADQVDGSMKTTSDLTIEFKGKVPDRLMVTLNELKADYGTRFNWSEIQ